VAQAQFGRRSADRPERAEIHGAVDRGRGDHCRLSPIHTLAARRLPLCPTGNAAASDSSSLHRCLQRHGISRLPEVEGDKPDKCKFKTYPIGYFHVDIAEVRTEEGRLYLFVAIDRASKFVFVELHEKATMRVATTSCRR
jgi:hypothetical protein